MSVFRHIYICRIVGLCLRYHLLDSGTVEGAWNIGVVYVDSGSKGAVVKNPFCILGGVADTAVGRGSSQVIVG